jgi:integrase
LYVDQADIPATADVTNLARALAYLHPDYELMAYLAAYTGLHWGETAALTFDQIDPDGRTITVDRKIIERSAANSTSNHPKAARKGAPSTPGKHPAATTLPSASPTASRPPAPNSTPAPTRTA